MGTLSVLLGFAWWVVVGGTDPISMYLTRAELANSCGILLWLVAFGFAAGWLVREVRRRSFGWKAAVTVAVITVLIRAISFAISLGLASWWRNQWVGFGFLTVVGLLYLAASTLVLFLVVGDLFQVHLEESMVEGEQTTISLWKRISEDLAFAAFFCLLYV